MLCLLTGLVLRSQAAVGWRWRLDRDDIMREVLTVAAGEIVFGGAGGCAKWLTLTDNSAKFAMFSWEVSPHAWPVCRCGARRQQ